MTATECASNIMRRRSIAIKRIEHSWPGRTRVDSELSDAFPEVLRTPLKEIRPTGMHRDHARWYTSIETFQSCVAYSPHASFKAHSPLSDSLHINVSIWLVCSARSTHKSKPLVRMHGYLLFSVPYNRPIVHSSHRNHF